MKSNILGWFIILLVVGVVTPKTVSYVGSLMTLTVHADDEGESEENKDNDDDKDNDKDNKENDKKDKKDDKEDSKSDYNKSKEKKSVKDDDNEKDEEDDREERSVNTTFEKYDNEKEDDNEVEDDNKSENDDSEMDDEEYTNVKIVTNPDGTITKRYTKTEGNQIEIKEVTYNTNGDKIMERKMEKEDGQEELHIKTYDIYGEKVSEYELKTKNGAIVKVEYDKDGLESKVKFNVEKKEFVIEGENENDDDEIKIKSEDDVFSISEKGITAKTVLPITIQGETGAILVKTPKGNVQLKLTPDAVVEKIKKSKNADVINEVSLIDEDGLKYVIKGTKIRKLLGIFTVEIKNQQTYNAQNGQYVSSQQGLIASILDLFSF